MLQITKGFVFKAQKVVVYGPEGIGKTTFAAAFPEALFIDTEGSTNLMNVARTQKPTSWTMLLQMIRSVTQDPNVCKTLVIDTIDWAEQLCVAHICNSIDPPKKSIEDFGYGKGYVMAREEIGRMLNLLQDIIDAGINVVLTAHAQIRKFEQPNEIGSYDRYELKLGQKTSSSTSALVKEWADIVLFANYKVHVVEIDKKKKSQGGSRVMYTTHHASWDAKNRHSLPPELPFEYNSIAYCIPNDLSCNSANMPSVAAIVAENVQQEKFVVPPVIEAQPRVMVQQQITTQQPSQSGVQQAQEMMLGAEVFAVSKDDQLAHIKQVSVQLYDLMKAHNVTEKDIQQVVSIKGYYPLDTPIRNYDPGFVAGVLVGAWDQVYKAMETPF